MSVCGAPRGRPIPRSAAYLLGRPPDARRWTLLRYRAGLTQAEAARRSGVPATYISDIECGRANAGPITAQRLEALYVLYDDGLDL